FHVTGVQTCALPIYTASPKGLRSRQGSGLRSSSGARVGTPDYTPGSRTATRPSYAGFCRTHSPASLACSAGRASSSSSPRLSYLGRCGFLLLCSWHENLPDDPHGRWVGQILDSSFEKLDFFLAMADNITVTRLAEQTSHHPRLVVVVDGEPTGLA